MTSGEREDDDCYRREDVMVITGILGAIIGTLVYLLWSQA